MSTVSEVEQLVTGLERFVGALEPECLDDRLALHLLDVLSRGAKVLAAAQALVARRVDACGAHRATGHLSTAHLVAETAGISVGRARDVVETGLRMRHQPGVDAAFRSGSLSLEQATAVSDAVAADPGAERGLLAAAECESLRGLQQRARAVRAAAEDDRLGRYRRQCAARYVRHWVDSEGMGRGEWALPPDAAAALVGRLETEANRIWRAAAEEGRHESHEHCAADALVDLVTRDGQERRPAGRDVEVVVLVDYAALLRGDAGAGERCEVTGVGDIPVEVARRIMVEGAFLKGVLVDGVEVRRVRHFGRHVSAEVRTALGVESWLRNGRIGCEVPRCDSEQGVEMHHPDALGDGGVTELDNLELLCRDHHRAEHERRLSEAGPAP